MAQLTLEQEAAFDRLRTDIGLRNEYVDIFRQITEHEKAIAVQQRTIDNYKRGSFKPPNNDISPWEQSVRKHNRTIDSLKDRAQQVRDVLFTKKTMLDMLDKVITDIGEIDDLNKK